MGKKEHWNGSVLVSAVMHTAFAGEVFDQALEAMYLKNIRQLTFPSMNFEKAGEAYFSPDDQNIVFQAVPTGSQHYQIYSMNLEEGIPP